MVVRVVAGAIRRGDRVLVARRGPGRRDAGLWELPGGKVEEGEADAVALVRELYEELRVRAAVGPLIGVSEVTQPDRTLQMFAYAVSTADPPVATEHAALRWATVGELAGLDWAPADIPLIDALVHWLVADDS